MIKSLLRMDYLRMLRPAQWSKNLFLFFPLFFGGAIEDVERLLMCFVAFVAFCCVSSSIYILNDIQDVAYDRLHPEKCHRPIAAGRVNIICATAYSIMLLLLAVALCLFTLSIDTLIVLCIYYFINLAYCYYLKRIALLDVMIISLGFVLRVIAGAKAAMIEPSHWIVIMTFLLSLFLALSKRYDDVARYEKTKQPLRNNIVAYNKTFLSQSITLTAGVTLVSYIMYTVDADIVERLGSPYVYTTAIFVLAGILRYLQLTFVDERSWSPTRILSQDRFLQVCIIGWLFLFAIIIYG